MEISLINYGAGNLRSVKNAFELLNVNVKVIDIENLKEEIKKSDAIILPGVGNFENISEKIYKKEEIFKDLKIPFLGICLGLQILFEGSEEAENKKGLGILKGKCLKFKRNLKVPHIGWNKVNVIKEHKLLENINEKFFYFAHSYHAPLIENFVYGITEYGIEFPSIVIKENFMATQFHPEKSGKHGIKFLENWIKWIK